MYRYRLEIWCIAKLTVDFTVIYLGRHRKKAGEAAQHIPFNRNIEWQAENENKK